MLNKYQKMLLPVLFFTLIILSSCSRASDERKTDKEGLQTEYAIYCVNNSETKVVSEPYVAEHEGGRELIEELIERLSVPPEELGLKQAILDDIKVVSFEMDEGVLNLKFGEAYNSMSGVAEVLRRAAVVKTLCQVKDIKYVKYTVGEQPLLYSDMTPVGKMKAEDFIDNTSGETTYYQTVHLTLYYTDQTGKQLFPARHNVEFDGTISLERLVLEQLIKGPLESEKLFPVIPEKTKVNKVSSKDGICYVDFSKEFLSGMDGVKNDVIIYSVVNSLSEIGSVTKVVFSVDGSPVDLYRENINLSTPLERKLEIVGEK